MNNDFNFTFGKEPDNYISRGLQELEVIDSFNSKTPSYQACMITGVRGCGKTVTMTAICNELKKNEDWIVIELSPERDLIAALVSELYEQEPLKRLFKEARISVSIPGLQIEIKGENPIMTPEIALDRQLALLTQKGKRILIAIDEVVSSKFVREFASQFQIYVRRNYSIFFIMTGLHENISSLQDEKTLTFLYRTPKIQLKPLNLDRIASEYKRIFELSDEEAKKMAEVTKGYAFAFQALGYLCARYNKGYEEVLPEFDEMLEDYVYQKITSELSEIDARILRAMASIEETKVEKIRETCQMDSNKFTVYRNRLLKKGVIIDTQYGHLDFALPRFREYINRRLI